MSNGLDIETIIKIKSFDLLKTRTNDQIITISIDEMFDNSLIVKRLSAQEVLTPDEKFLVEVITTAEKCKYTDKQLYKRCSAIIDSMVECSLNPSTEEEVK